MHQEPDSWPVIGSKLAGVSAAPAGPDSWEHPSLAIITVEQAAQHKKIMEAISRAAFNDDMQEALELDRSIDHAYHAPDFHD